MNLYEGIDGIIGPNYRLCDVAAALGRAAQSLKAMATRGQFPRLFRLSRNDWRVEQEALVAWASGRWADTRRSLRAEAVQRSIRQPARLRRES